MITLREFTVSLQVGTEITDEQVNVNIDVDAPDLRDEIERAVRKVVGSRIGLETVIVTVKDAEEGF